MWRWKGVNKASEKRSDDEGEGKLGRLREREREREEQREREGEQVGDEWEKKLRGDEELGEMRKKGK